jgi:ABC-type nitrate/sulfonate/bicarbonate transport system substrate-binding protein
MNVVKTFSLVLLSASAVACTAQPPGAAPAAATVARHKSGSIRFALNGAPSVKDIPSLMALDALEATGYDTQTFTFANTEQIVDPLSRGDIEIGSPSTNAAWTAIAKGGDFRTIVGRGAMNFYLVVPSEVQSCQDLRNKSVGFSTAQSAGHVMFRMYLKTRCPGIQPQTVLIPGSVGRAVALASNKIGGAYLELGDWLPLYMRAPDKFHVLLDFDKEFPGIQYSTFSARRAWAVENPDAVRDFIRELLRAQRDVLSKPRVLSAEIVKRLSLTPDEAESLAAVYLRLGVWDPNGGLTTDNLQRTLDFFTQNGAVPPGRTVADFADTSYLDRVVGELGRVPIPWP